MRVEERYEALALAESVELERLADRILAGENDVRVVSGPESVTAPVRFPVPGTTQTTTVLGHVALTMCTVTLGEVRGDGVRSGRDLPGAVAAAVCDAEAARGGYYTEEVHRLCVGALGARESAAQGRAVLVDSTRVVGAS